MLKFITNRHPFTYAILYLLLIPSYALLYSKMNRSFFHPTAKYETRLYSDKIDILSSLERDFKRYEGELDHRDTIRQDTSILMVDDFEAINFWVNNDFGYFLCNITLVDPRQGLVKGKMITTSKHDLIIKFYLLWSLEHIDLRDTAQKVTAGKLAEFLDMNEDTISNIGGFNLRGLFGMWFDPKHEPPPTRNQITYIKHFDVNEMSKFNFSSKVGEPAIYLMNDNLVITKELDQKILNYFGAINGFPDYFFHKKSNFLRMLYFSAITIATVGYGDIVPVTDGARIAVSSEAILGIILIGLFLNGLASKIRDRTYR